MMERGERTCGMVSTPDGPECGRPVVLSDAPDCEGTCLECAHHLYAQGGILSVEQRAAYQALLTDAAVVRLAEVAAGPSGCGACAETAVTGVTLAAHVCGVEAATAEVVFSWERA